MNDATLVQGKARALRFIGAGSGSGGRDAAGNAAAPLYAEPRLRRSFPQAEWQTTVIEPVESSSLRAIHALCSELATETQAALRQGALPVVIGGDHSCAVGTWSGVAAHVQQTARCDGEPGATPRRNPHSSFGLLWVDAHMDSHTFATSDTGNIHGMPLAALLGHGDAQLTQIAGPAPKLQPEQVVMFGIRSYEEGEARLLRDLGVRVYFMDEIARRGVLACFAEALHRVAQAPAGFGLTFDLDALDPADAPATCCREPGGLRLAAMQEALALLPSTRLLAAEFVELNPHLPGAEHTVAAMSALIQACTGAQARPAAALPLKLAA